MRYNRLGKSDITVSEISFGCMSMQLDTPQANINLIHKAIDSGINFFDTADLYDFGENEKLLGTAIQGQRDKLIIATKVGNQWNADRTGWSWNVSKEYIHKAIDDSLKRLQTDYIDLYQIHGGTKEDDFEEVVDTLENLIRVGKIRAYGISSIRPNVFLRFAKESNMVSNLMQFSLLDTRPNTYVDTLKTADVSILARGVLAQGILVNKEPKEYLDHKLDTVQNILKVVDQLVVEHTISKEAIALSYLLRFHKITSAIVGIRNQEQLQSLLDAHNELDDVEIDFQSLDIPQIAYTNHLA